MRDVVNIALTIRTMYKPEKHIGNSAVPTTSIGVSLAANNIGLSCESPFSRRRHSKRKYRAMRSLIMDTMDPVSISLLLIFTSPVANVITKIIF